MTDKIYKLDELVDTIPSDRLEKTIEIDIGEGQTVFYRARINIGSYTNEGLLGYGKVVKLVDEVKVLKKATRKKEAKTTVIRVEKENVGYMGYDSHYVFLTNGSEPVSLFDDLNKNNYKQSLLNMSLSKTYSKVNQPEIFKPALFKALFEDIDKTLVEIYNSIKNQK